MKQNFWKRIRGEITIWQVAALPGAVIIAAILLARLFGALQLLEWIALDQMLRSRPAEPTDQRVVIVGITESDIRRIGTYPIPDRDIATLLQTIQTYQPQVVGLDIFRDLPVQPGHEQLVSVFRRYPNLVGVEKALPDQSGLTVNPPPSLPPQQIGTADALFDTDGVLRRYLLGTSDAQGNYHFSLAIRLAEQYLRVRKIRLDNGDRDPDAMRFGSVELTRFRADTGGYVKADDGGNQMLLNFRQGCTSFRTLSLQDLQSGKVAPDALQGRIVLIGITAPSIKDVVNAPAIACSTPGLTYGVEIQAHAVSQIISAVLDQRPLLQTWPDSWEYSWIIVWGILGISLGRILRSISILLLGVAIAITVLVGICYSALLWGWWLPIVPAGLALGLNGTGLAAALFYRHERDLRSRLKERQEIIEETSQAIHNGPLQRLAQLLRQEDSVELSVTQLFAELRLLNQELRSAYEAVHQETLLESHQFSLISERSLDLQTPLHQLFQEVYEDVLSRDFPYFKTLRVKIVTFEPLDDRLLTIKQKRKLCRFLEEALCNVGRHAVGAKKLTVICRRLEAQNIIRIEDDGAGFTASAKSTPPYEGLGTRQAKQLAHQLHGHFSRMNAHPQGTVCELRWSVRNHLRFRNS